MLHLSRTCRNSFASFHMCLSGSGTVSEVAGAALLLAQSGQGCPSTAALLMALGLLWALSLLERTVLTYILSFLKTMNLLLVQPHP